jgi:hypothetical protein
LLRFRYSLFSIGWRWMVQTRGTDEKEKRTKENKKKRGRAVASEGMWRAGGLEERQGGNPEGKRHGAADVEQ